MKNLATKNALTLVSSLIFVAFASLGHAQGNAAAGESKVAVCAACHGPAGQSTIGANPKLALTLARYLCRSSSCRGLASRARDRVTVRGRVRGRLGL